MRNNVKRKLFMGIGGFMIPIPQVIASRGLQRGVAGAKTKAGLLSAEERSIHHFIVNKMADTKSSITAELVGRELDLPVDRVARTINKLEDLKTFLYRSDGKGINWAYPLSLEDTSHRITDSMGKRFFAA